MPDNTVPPPQAPVDPLKFKSPHEHHPHHPAPLGVLRRHIQNSPKVTLPFLLTEVIRACMKQSVYGSKPISEVVANIETQLGRK